MSWESPITQIVQEVTDGINKNLEETLMVEIKMALGYEVDKDELIKALEYDRHQYERGYADGLNADKWIPVDEKLPEEDGCYLVTTSGTNNDIIDIAYYTSGLWHKASYIKAWQSLPKPYNLD